MMGAVFGEKRQVRVENKEKCFKGCGLFINFPTKHLLNQRSKPAV